MPNVSVRDVVLSSRVRLARNFSDLPFPAAMHGEDGAEAQFRVADALAHSTQGQAYALFRIHDLPDTRRRALVEKRLISRELLSAGEHAAVLLRRDDTACIMINEDDHLRIHAMLPGLALHEAAALAFQMDDAIGQSVHYAFDAELGFLTSRPADAGTGMRASVLLHLPSMARSGTIGQLGQEAAKLGLSLRPPNNENGETQGDLYLIANQVSLGRSEQDLLDTVSEMSYEIVDRERAARELLLLHNDPRLEDRLLRSVGILRYARRMSEAEWMRRWSDARLAVQAGLFSVDLSVLDALLDDVKPAHLELLCGRELSPVERDEQRAQIIREALGVKR